MTLDAFDVKSVIAGSISSLPQEFLAGVLQTRSARERSATR
jgi:hypothetical protein